MAIEDKLSYCNLQGPVTIGVRRPHHKTSALVTPGGFGLLYYLIVKDHRVVKTRAVNSRHDVLRSGFTVLLLNSLINP